MTVLILQGLPASGKTTFAMQHCAQTGAVRVNKDEIRASLRLHGWVWSQKAETRDVIPARDRAIRNALENGLDVVVDDTNLMGSHIRDIERLAGEYGADVMIKTFGVPVDECIRRDALRNGDAHVGEAVIRRMAGALPRPVTPYQETPGLPWCVICDLDGTLALKYPGRDIYDGTLCHKDAPNRPVAFILEHLPFSMVEVIFVSGREDTWREQTHEFLNQRLDIPHPRQLYMRAAGDRRDDVIVKQELFDQHIRGKFNVLFVLDDRNRVVRMWRALGLTCLQVADGAF